MYSGSTQCNGSSHTYAHTHTEAIKHINMYIHTCIHTHVLRFYAVQWKLAEVLAYAHRNYKTHTHTYIDTYIDTYIHTYTRMYSVSTQCNGSSHIYTRIRTQKL